MVVVSSHTRLGDMFTGRPKRIIWERLWTFSGGRFSLTGWPAKNIHTDLEFAKSCGLPSVTISGNQSEGYLAELMIDLFGVEWLSHGRMDMKFIGLVDAGDTLVTRAVIQSKEAQDGATKCTLDVYCENQRGENVCVGVATGIIGKVDPSEGVINYRNRLAELMSDSTMQHDIAGGPQLEPLEFVVTPEFNQQYCYSQEDFHPRYIEGTEIGPPIAHPGLLINWSSGTRSPSYRVQPGQGGIMSHDEVFFCNPARVGKKLKVTWKEVGTYEKRGRPYSVSEASVVDEDGLEIIRRLSHGTIAAPEYQKAKT